MEGGLNSDGNEEGRGENERMDNNSKEVGQKLYGMGAAVVLSIRSHHRTIQHGWGTQGLISS